MIHHLTEHERIVWRGIIEGRKMAAIAHDLGVCERTAQSLRASLKKKLGVITTDRRTGGACGLVRVAALIGLFSRSTQKPKWQNPKQSKSSPSKTGAKISP